MRLLGVGLTTGPHTAPLPPHSLSCFRCVTSSTSSPSGSPRRTCTASSRVRFRKGMSFTCQEGGVGWTKLWALDPGSLSGHSSLPTAARAAVKGPSNWGQLSDWGITLWQPRHHKHIKVLT